ncbi:RNA-binding S4 domain-containing protein [Propionibacteriaceae bacterium Y2011]|uniref:RNA-binding S4 domain-containing protein n=1 Tax=Microlunatus sp. Y2014 TaxID=3418488 RepID=UPI003B461ABE
MTQPTTIEVTGPTIRLGQLLKLAGMIDSGSDVKELLAAGEVLVNGEHETRRGRQLVAGDVVECAGEAVRLAVPA